MSKEHVIKTKSVGKNFLKSDYVPLEITSDTALVFGPEIHLGGVRGHLIRFKKNRNDEWERIPEENFKKLQLFDGTYTLLTTDALNRLVTATQERKRIVTAGVPLAGEREWIVAPKDGIVKVDNRNIKSILENILNQNLSEDFWSILKELDPQLVDKLVVGHAVKKRQEILDILKWRLTQNFPETKGSESWQDWIYKNSWLFGVVYQRPIQKARININGIMPDYIFPRLDGFVDILEIKLPAQDVVVEDPNHSGSWIWSAAVNLAIGQVVNYLSEIEKNRLTIEGNIKDEYNRDVLMLKPKGYILIGRTDGWSSSKRQGLKKLNHSLHDIEVLTYTDLIERGRSSLCLN